MFGRFLKILCLALAIGAAFIFPAQAQQTRFAKKDIGVVFMHGRLGSPDYLEPLSRALRAEGYLVETPEMPWSRRRAFDATVDETMREIDEAAVRLRARGAKVIIIGGHSLGGAAALRYGASRANVDALILVAAQWNPQWIGWQRIVGPSLVRARKAIDAGQDMDDYQYLTNEGEPASMRAHARGYLDYHRADSAMGVPASAKASTRPIPVLWLSANGDGRNVREQEANTFESLPRHPASRHDTLISPHISATTPAIGPIGAWIEQLRR